MSAAEKIGVGIAERRHQVGHCPGCGCGLWVDVIVDTELRPPHLDAAGKAVASVTAHIVKVSIHHDCAGVNDR